MRSSALLFGAAMMLGLAACGPDGREVEPVLPGEGPTYAEPATATPAPGIGVDSLVFPDSLTVADSLRRDSAPPLMDPLTPPPPQ